MSAAILAQLRAFQIKLVTYRDEGAFQQPCGWAPLSEILPLVDALIREIEDQELQRPQQMRMSHGPNCRKWTVDGYEWTFHELKGCTCGFDESRSPDGDGPLRARNLEQQNAADDEMSGRRAREAISRAAGECGQATPGAGSEPADSHTICRAVREAQTNDGA